MVQILHYDDFISDTGACFRVAKEVLILNHLDCDLGLRSEIICQVNVGGVAITKVLDEFVAAV
jgi:hypothetical protein